MRFTITTSGSRGDVQPYVALGHQLVQDGHEVTIAAPSEFESLVKPRGPDFVGVNANPRTTTERMLRDRPGLLGFAYNAREALRPVLPEMLESYLRACEHADVVLYTPIGFFGHTLSIELDLPRAGLAVQPLFQRTAQFPSPFSKPLPQDCFGENIKGPSLRAYNKSSHQLTEQALWQLLRSPINDACKSVLGYRPYSVSGPFSQLQADREPGLFGWSPSVLPKPSDWGQDKEVSGYWFLPEEAPDYFPPDDLQNFINDGPKPISVGFGSMNDPEDPNHEQLTQIVVDAVARSGQRAVLVTGWGGLSSTDLPSNMFAIEQLPYDWLFNRVSAAVHHGGAGTTAASLRAGIPTVTVPFLADQPFWGSRIAQLGVGPRPVPRSRLDAKALSDAILRALWDAGMRQRAADLGEIIRSENGAKHAAESLSRRFVGTRAGGSP